MSMDMSMDMSVGIDTEKEKDIKENKILIDKYPFLKPQYNFDYMPIEEDKDYNYSFTELDGMPPGWKKTFGERICKDIKAELVKIDALDKYRIDQIKEKFGSLRWYDNNISQNINDIISKYEIISTHTCVLCGSPYAKMYNFNAWISPYCEECAKKYIKKKPDYFNTNNKPVEKNTKTQYIRTSAEHDEQIITVDATDLLNDIRNEWDINNNIKNKNSKEGKIVELNKNCPYCEPKCEDIGCNCPKYLAYLDAKDPAKVKQIMEKYGFDTSLPAWDLMMQMQTSFEVRFHPMDGLTKEEKEHWLDRYLVCIEDEIREVREHLSLYKPYTYVDNKTELKKEVIDIWHFVMDLFLALPATPQSIKEAYEKYYQITIDGDLIESAYNFQRNTINTYLNTKDDINPDITILKAACKLSDSGSLIRQQVSWKHWKKPNKELNYERIYEGFAVVFHEIINLSILTMEVNEIKDIYMQKNIENIFRQEHGY